MTTPAAEPTQRQLVVCEGGPLSGQWFWADEFAARQEATRRTSTPFTPAAAQASLAYRSTGRTREQRKTHHAALVLTYRGYLSPVPDVSPRGAS